MVPNHKPPVAHRRSVLCTAGGIVSGTLSLTTTGNGPTISSVHLNSEAFEGVAYDPVTHEVLGDATATLRRSETSLRGTLQLLGRRVDLNLRNPAVESFRRGEEKSRFRDLERKRTGSTYVSALVVSYPNGVTGYVLTRTGKRIGFSVASTTAGLSKEDARNAVIGGNEQ